MKKETVNKIIAEFSPTGFCKIDVELLAKKWNKLFWISEYNGEYRLIKYTRKDSPNTRFKVSISPAQARQIIKRLDLIRCESTLFSLAASWRRDSI